MWHYKQDVPMQEKLLNTDHNNVASNRACTFNIIEIG